MRVACLLCVLLVSAVVSVDMVRRSQLGVSALGVDGDIANFVLSAMNNSVDPCDDFYAYSCGGWMSTFVLPPSEGAFPRSIGTISASNSEILQGICGNPDNGKVSSSL
jgi:predicted metalloendopeptidase